MTRPNRFWTFRVRASTSGVSGQLVRQLDELAHEVRVVLHLPVELDALHALDENPQRPVGNLDHLVDHRGGADLVEVVPARLLRLRVLDRDEREHAVTRDDVFDQLDRALLADRERRHRLGKDDRVLQRKNRQGRRERELLRRLLDERVAHCFAHRRCHHDRDALRRSRLRGDRQLDGEKPALVGRGRLLRIDVHGQRHLTLKRAVLDLELLVLPAILGSLALTGDEERLRRRDHLHLTRVDSGELDDDGEGGRALGPVDVDLRPIAAAHPSREGKNLPEIGEELLDLLGSVSHVPSAFFHRLRVPRQARVETCAVRGPQAH